ncbi:MAG: alpha/beta hydrolase [Acidimicrobiia bacterium]
MRSRLGLLVLILVACSAPAASTTTRASEPLVSTTAAAPAVAIFAPETKGAYPVVVMFHGGGWFGGSPISTAPLAEYLAGNGVVVFNSTYRTSTGGYPESFDDIACAIRDARTEASEYTTTVDEITVVGHSAGAHLGAVVSLSGEIFGGDCANSEGVNRFIGLSGVYDPTLYTQLLATFFHTRFENDPEPWKAGNPYTYVDDNPDLEVLLLHGDDDQIIPMSSSELFAAALTAAGHNVTLEVISGGDHQSTRQPDTAGPVIIDFLVGG